MKDIRKGRENRSLYLRGILPYLFALGCARAWVTLAVAAPALALPAAFDLLDIFDYAFCLISIAVALAARRLLPLNATGWMRAASAALMVAASLCLIAVGIGLVAGPAAIALVAAGAAAGKNLAAVLGGHTGTEAMHLRALALLGLISSDRRCHCYTLLSSGEFEQM